MNAVEEVPSTGETIEHVAKEQAVGANTKIEWCDHTFSPWRGCTKVAAGCANCYAEAQAKRNTGTLGIWGPNGTRVVAAESAWKQVEKWDRMAKDGVCRLCNGSGRVDVACREWDASGELIEETRRLLCHGGCYGTGNVGLYRSSVFCGSMCDVFEDWPGQVVDSNERRLHVAPSGKWCPDGLGSPVGDAGWRPLTMSDVRNRVFNLIDATRLTWLLLTKRPENIRPMWHWRDCGDNPGLCENWQRKRPNVWLGTSIACQEDAERNIPELLKCRDLCRGVFLSIEPLVGPVDLTPWIDSYQPEEAVCLPIEERNKLGWKRTTSRRVSTIDQVIIGGESGPHARPCRVEWVRSIVRQCEAAGVPCFVKQFGANVITRNDLIEDVFNDGREGWPEPDVEHNIHGFREDYQGADCRIRLRDKKGGDPSEWPEDLRVRKLAWKGGA